MKVIIDLIEDIRETIGDAEEYTVYAGLLKEDAGDASKLVYMGEAPLSSYTLENKRKELLFHVGGGGKRVTIGELLPSLLILDMQSMMYPLKMDLNAQYKDMEIVGFGKNDEEKHYILFIKI